MFGATQKDLDIHKKHDGTAETERDSPYFPLKTRLFMDWWILTAKSSRGLLKQRNTAPLSDLKKHDGTAETERDSPYFPLKTRLFMDWWILTAKSSRGLLKQRTTAPLSYLSYLHWCVICVFFRG